MVNITYDACMYSLAVDSVVQILTALSAGQLNWFNPDTGKTVVYNGGDIAWTLASTALVWIMVPGVGFFYSGLLRRKNGLSMIYLSVGTIAVVSFQVSLNTLPSRLYSIWCESGSSGASLWHSAILQIFSSATYVSILLARFWRCRTGLFTHFMQVTSG